jgi:triphosphoribosyl-dephospho-CoA synthase
MNDAPSLAFDWPPAVTTALARLDAACTPGSRGWCVAVACLLEATVSKPGNVHPRAAFPDLCYDELVAAGLAIAPVLGRAANAPLGATIETAVEASAAVTRTNANLGIVLALTPLAAVAEPVPTSAGVAAVLARLTPGDAAATYRAIARARPGGLGHTDRFDVHAPPPADLRAAMRAAAGHDSIARLWAEDFAPLFAGPVRDLAASLAAGGSIEDAVLDTFLMQLAREPDSLIVRRHGRDVAATVSARAAAVLTAPAAERQAAVAFLDRDLRLPRRINPGTTADLVAAALYVLLRTAPAGPPP